MNDWWYFAYVSGSYYQYKYKNSKFDIETSRYKENKTLGGERMNKKLEYVYPACIYPNDDGTYTAMFPDLKGCVTEGKDLIDVLKMLEEAGCAWVLSELEEGKKVPCPSDIKNIKADEYDNGFTSLIVLDIKSYSEKYSNRAVRKNCTIPYWLDTFASKNNISLSHVLQSALLNLYQDTKK